MTLPLPLALLVGSVLTAATGGEGVAIAPVSPERFLDHIAWLAHDDRGGRQTGTGGYEAAARYVADEFALAGLRPGGVSGWFQPFQAAGGRILLEGNRLLVGGRELVLHEDWIPFPSTASCEVSGPLVFAGYGIRDEEVGYDDYAGLDVEGRVVVVLRKGPGRTAEELEGLPEHEVARRARWLDGPGRRHISFAAKINAAYKAGAAAILIVNDPGRTEPGSEEDALIPYRSGALGRVSASLPAAHLTAAAGRDVLLALGVDLAALRRAIDRDVVPRSFALPSGTGQLTVVTEREKVDTVNVVGLLPPAGEADEYVLVGAHLDHLGLGQRSGSLGGQEAAGRIHNGADDNASGISALIEVAHALARGAPGRRRGVAFVAFGAEEWGLLGSRHWAEHPLVPLEDTVAMINMDMVGRGAEGRVEVAGVGTAAGFEELVGDVHAALGAPLELSLSPGVTGNSDHAPFVEERVPTLSLFTGLHDDYHRPSDDVDKIEAESGAHIATLAAALAARLAGEAARPAFVDPDAEEEEDAPGDGPDPHDGQQVIGYGVSFGSRPDMTYTRDDGVRISGTRAGSPAERCGLREGDVIVALDGKTIRNLEDYSVLLFSHRPGDTISVTVRRDGEDVELSATLEGRKGDA